MARHATGAATWQKNDETGVFCWHARVTHLDGDRKATPVDVDEPWVTQHTAAARELAQAYARVVSAALRGGSLAPMKRAKAPSTAENVEQYAKRWAATGKGQDDKSSHLRIHVLPILGAIPMARVQAHNLEDLVSVLDRKIGAQEMSDKTARNVWATVARMFNDAAHSKPAKGLRCLESDPAKDVEGPDSTGEKKAKQFIYPDEFLRFVWCEAIPLHWRRNVAIAVYSGLRDDEQRALRWTSVDLDHGVINVTETTDAAGDVVTGTKGNAAHRVKIHPHLLPLLRALHQETKGHGRVCQRMSSKRDMARGLRRWLNRAGVTRPELHETTRLSLNMRWHDLRATCATWWRVAGQTEDQIQEKIGHSSVEQTKQYLRNAELVQGLPFPALPELLITAGFIFSAFRAEKAKHFSMLSGVDGTRNPSESPIRRALQGSEDAD